MKKSYALLAAICLIGSLVLSIQSPVSMNNEFVLNGNALSEDKGFEDKIGMQYQENQESISNTADDLFEKRTEQLTEDSEYTGVGKSFNVDYIPLKENTSKNIGVEDVYIKPEEPQKTETPSKQEQNKKEENETKAKYKKIKDSNEVKDFNPEAEGVKSLGDFKLTAYCPCESCCDEYGKNRPTDEDGYVIVKTATGKRAYANHTIAVDPKVIPYGSKVIIERNGKFYEYVATDCGGAIKSNRIDVYFDSHKEALKFGVRHGNVYIVE